MAFIIMTQNQKHWLYSSIQSFLSGFVVAIIPYLATLDYHNITNAVIVGILVAGVRAGFKALGATIKPIE